MILINRLEVQLLLKKEKLDALSEDSEDSIDSEDSEDTPLKDDKYLENIWPESKEDTSKVVDTLGTESQPGVTKYFGATTLNHPPIKDSSSNTSLSWESIMAIKEQNLVEDLRKLVKSRGMSIVSRSLISSATERNLNKDSACLHV